MAKYIKGKDGKFAGSIGDGKTVTPSAAPTIPGRPDGGYPDGTPEYGQRLIDMLDRLNNSLDPNKRHLPDPNDIYAALDVEEVTPNWDDYDPEDPDGPSQQVIREIWRTDPAYTPGALNVLHSGRVSEDRDGNYVADVVWTEPKADWEPRGFIPSDTKYVTGEIGTYDTLEEAEEAVKRAIAHRVPLEQEFTELVEAGPSEAGSAIAADHGFALTARGTRRSHEGGRLYTEFASDDTTGDVPARKGYVSMRADGSYLGVVRYAGNDLNKTTNPTAPLSNKFTSAREARDWVEHHLGSRPVI